MMCWLHRTASTILWDTSSGFRMGKMAGNLYTVKKKIKFRYIKKKPKVQDNCCKY